MKMLVLLCGGFIATLAPGVLAAGIPLVEPLVEDNTAFGLHLYGQLRARGNLILSPYSISSALAMTYAGARGQTALQMEQALRFQNGMTNLHSTFQQLNESLNALREDGKLEVSLANSLWPMKRYALKDEFLTLIKAGYGAEITPLDFAKEAENSRMIINSWVDDQTRHKITDIIPPGGVDALTRLVLVNAIYFKGAWAHPFSESQTRIEDFRVNAATVIKSAFMRQTADFSYGENDQLQLIIIPYQKNRLEMAILLPRKPDGLEELEGGLAPDKLTVWRASVRREKVIVSLPKFKMTTSFELANPLQSIGMTDAFSPLRADFSGMDGHRRWLYISRVIHKAFIDVNETGTEAAAATAVTMRATAMRRESEPRVFRADHPFFFLIRDSLTGTILFLGRVAQPSDK